MKKLVKICTALLALLPTQLMAQSFNIKYSSNYLMPAYVQFNENGTSYSVQAQINVPLYKIRFSATGSQASKTFNMYDYKDIRNDKIYAQAKISRGQIEYGKVKNGLETEKLTLPTFDLFTMAFQLTYYDKLPTSFQITNGKKLYPMENVVLNKTEKQLNIKGQTVTEITYRFKTGNKDITVKKYQGEQFPRYLSYNKDGDEYELEFAEFVK